MVQAGGSIRPTGFTLRRFPQAFAPLLAGLLFFHVASPLLGRLPLASLFLTILLLWTSVPAISPARRERIAAIAGLTLVIIARAASIWRGGETTALDAAGFVATAAPTASLTSTLVRNLKVPPGLRVRKLRLTPTGAERSDGATSARPKWRRRGLVATI